MANSKYFSLGEDEVAVARQIGRDPAVFERVYRQFMPAVHELCYGILRDASDADEASSDVFECLHRKADTFKGDSAFATWFYTLTMNVALMRLRRKKNVRMRDALLEQDPFQKLEENPRYIEDLRDHSLNAEEQLLQKEAVGRLMKVVNRLNPIRRKVFILKYIEDLKVPEISQALSISEACAKAHLFRAREDLRRMLSRKIMTVQ